MKLFNTLAFATYQGILCCRQIPDNLKRQYELECPKPNDKCGVLDGKEFKGCRYGELCMPTAQPAMGHYWTGNCISCAPQISSRGRCMELFYDKGQQVIDECMEKCHVPDLCAEDYDNLDIVNYVREKLNDKCGVFEHNVPNEGVYSLDEDGLYFDGLDNLFLGDFVKFEEIFANENLKHQFYSKNCQDGKSTSGASIAAIVPGGGTCVRGKINSRLHFKCGVNNKLLAVRHVSSCQYYFYFELICDDIDQFLADQNKSDGSIDWEDYSFEDLTTSDSDTSADDYDMYSDEDSSDDATLVDMPDVHLKMGSN